VSEAAERFIAEHIRVKNRASWAKEAERLIRIEVLPQISSYPLTQLKKADLSAVIARKMAEVKAKKRSGTVANRLSAIISRFIAFCADHGWLDAQIGIRLPKPAVEQARTRTLTPDELGQLWNALKPIREGHSNVWPVYGRVIAMLALTGCRCAEITGLHRRSIDLQAGTITIENGKTKASSRTLALPPLARGVLEEQLASANVDAPDDLVFPLLKGGRIPSNEVSRAARKIVKALGHQPWTPHDLRRTVVSVMAELGIDGDIRRRITGHQAQDVHGRVYDQAHRQNAVRAALLQVEQHVSEAARKVI
jgi:integrase